MFSMYCILSQHIHVPGYTLHGHIQNVLYIHVDGRAIMCCYCYIILKIEEVKVEQVGLKRGRCSQCKKKFTSYACAACRARVCVLECSGRLHKGQLLRY